MCVSPRIMEIAKEAAKTMTISLITSDERDEFVKYYKEATGNEINAWCDACIFKAAMYVYNQN